VALRIDPIAARTTAGRLALLAVLQRTTAAEVAARCDVTPAAVSKWSSGTSRPVPATRSKLESAYRIRAGAWDEPTTR
jgi:hypothetical protein